MHRTPVRKMKWQAAESRGERSIPVFGGLDGVLKQLVTLKE